MRDRPAYQSGLTLLEMVVAIAIFATIYVMAQQFFSSALTNREILARHARALESAQRTLIFLTMDLEQIIARPVRDQYGRSHPAVEGTAHRISVTRLGWANPMHLRNRSTMQRVTWYLKGDRLMRSYFRVLDRGPGAQPVTTVMMRNVKSFEVRYLYRTDSGKWRWSKRWPRPSERGGPPLRQPLPESLEITVERAQGMDLHRYFRLPENPWA